MRFCTSSCRGAHIFPTFPNKAAFNEALDVTFGRSGSRARARGPWGVGRPTTVSTAGMKISLLSNLPSGVITPSESRTAMTTEWRAVRVLDTSYAIYPTLLGVVLEPLHSSTEDGLDLSGLRSLPPNGGYTHFAITTRVTSTFGPVDSSTI